MSKFLIENDYYIVIDEYSYNLAQPNGYMIGRNGQRYETYKTIGYYSTIERALSAYLEISQREALNKAEEGTIADMMKILSSERERLGSRLVSLLQEVTDWKGSAA